jgi:hypothetical protein
MIFLFRFLLLYLLVIKNKMMSNPIICNVYPDILYSFLSKNGRTEWEYAYDKLTDLVFLEDFFSNQENERDLLYGFYKGKVDNITDAIILTQEMTETFFQLVLDCCENGGDINCLFKNLNKFDYKVESMISTRMQNDEDICDWLRLYGLRIGTTIISITGGTIKLTREMRDREHTRQELDKLGNYKIILNGYSVYDEESLKEYINTI